MTARLLVSIFAGFLCLSSCNTTESPAPAVETSAESLSAAASEPDAEDEMLIVFLGDSLTAGYGLEEEQAHPALVGERLRAESLPVRIVNAGVSGDTTAGGLSRLDWLLRQQPDFLVVSLGANDGMRGLPLESTEDNLRRIVGRAQEAGARVLLTGMKMPPNYGEYADNFAAIFPRIASEFGVPRVPFLLEGVAGRPELNLADGIHPNVEGQRVLAGTVLEALRPMVENRDRDDPRHPALDDSPGV